MVCYEYIGYDDFSFLYSILVYFLAGGLYCFILCLAGNSHLHHADHRPESRNGRREVTRACFSPCKYLGSVYETDTGRKTDTYISQ